VNVTYLRPAAVAAGLTAAALTLTACGSAGSAGSGSSAGSGTPKAATATSAADFGGMDRLVAAAKKEGSLNAIALPKD
jgi:putative spermidine/putrescine transport system substrate-binding protein